MMKASTRQKELTAAFVSLARRVPGLDQMTRVLQRLPVGSKDEAMKKALLKDLAAIDAQLRMSSRRIRQVADRVERLAVQSVLVI